MFMDTNVTSDFSIMGTSSGQPTVPAHYPFDGSATGSYSLDLPDLTWFNSSAYQYYYLGLDFPDYTVVQMLMRSKFRKDCKSDTSVDTPSGYLRGVTCRLRACARSYRARIENNVFTESPGPRQNRCSAHTF